MSMTIEKLQQDLQELHQRREVSSQQFHQLAGAISIVEQMIYRLQNPDWDKKTEEQENLPTMDLLETSNPKKEKAIKKANK